MAQQVVDWPRFTSDVVYRGHVLETVSRTQAGRDFLSRFAASFEDLPWDERLRLSVLLSIPDYTAEKPALSAWPAFIALGRLIASTGVGAAVVAGGRWIGSNVLKRAWMALAAGGWSGAGAAIGGFFAIDYVASKLQGNKAEIEKLYQAGRNVGGAVVSTTTTLVHFLPVAIVAAGVWLLFKTGKDS